jgi:hypothetical protein
MPARRRLFPWIAVAGVAAVAGCAPMPGPARSPDLMRRCDVLVGLWYRYTPVISSPYDGTVARAALAHYRCQQGRFRDGIPELESILREHRIPVPPPGTGQQLPLSEDF